MLTNRRWITKQKKYTLLVYVILLVACLLQKPELYTQMISITKMKDSRGVPPYVDNNLDTDEIKTTHLTQDRE